MTSHLFLYRLVVFSKNLINMRPFAGTQAAVSPLPYYVRAAVWVFLICYFVCCSRFGFFFSVSKRWAGLFSMSRFLCPTRPKCIIPANTKERSRSVMLLCFVNPFHSVRLCLNQFLLDSFAWSGVIAIYSK